MTTCGYEHIVLLGFLSSNGCIALILLKFKLFILSSAISNIWVTLRPTSANWICFHVIGQTMKFYWADFSSDNENKPHFIFERLEKAL